METAPPVFIDNKPNFKVSETFNMKVNENNIKLMISYNDEIILFEAEEENIFPKIKYNLIQSFEELLKLDKYFRQFDNLKEVFESIKIMINNNNLSIIKEESIIKLIIKNFSTNKEFYLNLKSKEKSTSSDNSNIFPFISSLNKKIFDLENNIKEMNINFDNKLKKIEQKHKEEINIYKIRIEKIEKYFQRNIKLFNNSNIIQSNENELIYKWLDNRIPISVKLLLNAKIDDNFYKSFFDNCGNKTNTMIFIKTSDGERFGGYTSVKWPTKGCSKDDNSFLFSLDKKEKYKIINPKYAIGVRENEWISFGMDQNTAYDLFIYGKLKSEGGGSYKKYYDFSGDNFTLYEGKGIFKISNCEIYQIEF